ncbi:MAG: chemotaxis-specific protein-glutamate methyltransferase CheB [Pseudomonadota bacterium]
MITARTIKVLIVDDSLFMRQLISRMLECAPDITVIDTAKDGDSALQKIAALKPDVVTMDLKMKGLDGLTTLKRIMKECPTPVVILSAYSKEDADITLQCLGAGAVSFLLKPSGELSLDIEVVKDHLLEQIRAASKVNVGKIKSLAAKGEGAPECGLTGIDKIIVIGASTGGPQSLEVILSFLPRDFPASIIVVQHMPTIAFTESVVRRLKKVCKLVVKVAEDDEYLHPGTVYFVPAGYDLLLIASRLSLVADKESSSAQRHFITPSINETMKKVSAIYKDKMLGIILTGMGSDGVTGMGTIKEHGGKTIAQDESSLIFGMPKEVIDAGFADKVLPLEKIADDMLKFVGSG